MKDWNGFALLLSGCKGKFFKIKIKVFSKKKAKKINFFFFGPLTKKNQNGVDHYYGMLYLKSLFLCGPFI